jgi:hypothetical protein
MNRSSSVFLGAIVSLVVVGCRQIPPNDPIQLNQDDEEDLLECLFPMNPRLLNEIVVVKDSVSTNGYILAYDYINSSMGGISSYAIKYEPNKIEISFGWSFQPDQWIKFETNEDVEIIRIPHVDHRKIFITDGQEEREVPRHDKCTEKDLWHRLGFSEKNNSVPDNTWQ